MDRRSKRIVKWSSCKTLPVGSQPSDKRRSIGTLSPSLVGSQGLDGSGEGEFAAHHERFMRRGKLPTGREPTPSGAIREEGPAALGGLCNERFHSCVVVCSVKET